MRTPGHAPGGIMCAASRSSRLNTELALERLEQLRAASLDLLVLERALGMTEGQAPRARALPLRDALAAELVEEDDVLEQVAAGFPQQAFHLRGGHRFRD